MDIAGHSLFPREVAVTGAVLLGAQLVVMAVRRLLLLSPTGAIGPG